MCYPGTTNLNGLSRLLKYISQLTYTALLIIEGKKTPSGLYKGYRKASEVKISRMSCYRNEGLFLSCNR